MPTLSNPELAEALEGANSLILRWGHNQMRQLKAEEVERIVAALKASASSETGPSLTTTAVLDAMKDHYWDSLEPQRELVIKHIEGVMRLFERQGG